MFGYCLVREYRERNFSVVTQTKACNQVAKGIACRCVKVILGILIESFLERSVGGNI
jgi:hypothetical protein